jgi:Ca2+-binding EF-hand superfamily protein
VCRLRQWDEDHDGLVSRKEFRKAMAVLGLEMTREDADGIFDRFDEDGSGQISYAEMKKALKKPATKKQPLAWWMNS